MGTHHDSARLRLSEDAGKSDYRNFPRVDDVAQNVSGSHTWQLVYIAHQHQAHVLRNRLHQIIHQDDVYHRTLIHDQRIALQRVLLVALVAVLRIEFQQSVDGLGFHARGLAHSLGSSARRSRQQNLHSCRLIGGDDTLRCRGFSCSWTTRKYHHLRAHCLLYGGNLHLVILDARSLFHRLDIGLHIEEGRALALHQGEQLLRRSPF